jgi:hypothetical protein
MTPPDTPSAGAPHSPATRSHDLIEPDGPPRLDPSRLDDGPASRAIANLLHQAPADPARLAAALLAHLELADRRHRLAMTTLSQLAATCARLQIDAQRLERRTGSLESSLHDVCRLLRELDDPYGFGLSVDEQLASEDEAPR